MGEGNTPPPPFALPLKGAEGKLLSLLGVPVELNLTHACTSFFNVFKHATPSKSEL